MGSHIASGWGNEVTQIITNEMGHKLKDGHLTKVQPMNSEGRPVNVFTVDAEKNIPPPQERPPSAEPVDYSAIKDPFQKRALAALETMTQILTKEQETAKKVTTRMDLIEEWKFVSRVIDRALFICFTLVCFFFNVVLLTSSPFRERFDYCPLGEGLCDDMTFEEIQQLTLHAASDSHVPGTGGGDGHGGGHGGGDGGGGGGHGGDGGGHGGGGGGGGHH
ncbi:hypothetical protein SK128_028524 [Halocaridina rubra]|uniref:Neurotransmitter-gated ion-channel transmembrane domain-containing protein n=1 Tax=Halocaridina rubra TaxID=373956 RepID=A0AAN9A915_HALRR